MTNNHHSYVLTTIVLRKFQNRKIKGGFGQTETCGFRCKKCHKRFKAGDLIVPRKSGHYHKSCWESMFHD